MSTETTYFVGAVVVGLGATLFMDVWALFLTRAFGIPSANYCLVGRWLCHMREGTFMHASIASVLVPYLIMQPSFGLGVAASRTPQPTQARLRSLMAHTVFGVGLYVCAVGVSHVLRVYA